MSKNSTPQAPVVEIKHEPATPMAERTPGQTAKENNAVSPKDSFGRPKGDPEWTREAITSQTVKPGFNGPEDAVSGETAKPLKI